LIEWLRPELSPWDFELQDRPAKETKVLGTRQWPMRYVNGVGMQCPNLYRTEHIRVGSICGETTERIDQEHVERMLALGILPENRPI